MMTYKENRAIWKKETNIWIRIQYNFGCLLKRLGLIREVYYTNYPGEKRKVFYKLKYSK